MLTPGNTWKKGVVVAGYTSVLCLTIIASTTAAEISAFPAGDAGWHLGTLAVGNLDSDSQLEIVVPYRDSGGYWHLDAYKLDGSPLPGFPYLSGPEEMNVSPTLYDLDGDGRDEIIFTRANNVVALRGDGSVLWSTRIDSSNYIPDGGYQTVTNGFYWWNGANAGFIPTLPNTAVFSSQVSPPIVADIKGTGVKEIVTSWKIDPDPTGFAQDYNPFLNDIFGFGEWGTVGETWSGGVVFFDPLTGRKNFAYHLHQLVESGLAIGQADPDGALETYVLNDSDSVVCFDKSQPHGLWGKGMLHKQFGKNQRLMTGSYKVGIDIQAVDIDGDGLDEVLVAGTDLSDILQPHETILDDDGAILWRKWRTQTNYVNNNGWLNNATMFAINPDHDNHLDVLSFTHSYEINFRYWNGVDLVNRAGWPKNFYPFLPTPPVVGDVDADGQEEIIIGTYRPGNDPSDGSLYIYRLDGTLKTSLAVPGGIKHIPSLADVNNDGSLDVIYRSIPGTVYVQNFGARRGAQVSWGTHRGNKHRDNNSGVSLYPAGTPLVRQKSSGYRKNMFIWTTETAPQLFHIYRADQASGPFVQIATVPSGVTNFTDTMVQSGWQYFYEVAAVYPTNSARSAPFALTPWADSNLIANAGFEENDNSHWDKWFTGDIPTLNMRGNTNIACSGRQSMEIKLANSGNNSSIAQYNQYGTPAVSIPASAGFYSMGCFLKSGGISQPSEHWLEWSSTKTADNTNNRPNLPWPDYFTPHFKIGTAAIPWTYANRVFTLPPGFPNLELRHRFTIASSGSGSIFLDNMFLRALPAPTNAAWINLSPFGAIWRYSVDSPPANWTAASFDQSIWPLGRAKFGAGATSNIVTRLPQQRSAYFFRRTFVVTNTAFEELLLAATCTDDYGGINYPLQVYLNGTSIPSAPIEIATGTGNEIRYFDLHPFIDWLRPGTNIIAIAIGNAWASDWDNVAFDISLKAIPSNSARTAIRSIEKQSGHIRIGTDTPVGTIWRLQSCDSLSPQNWQTFDTFTNTDGATHDTIDTGQSNRPSPSAAPTRFYRLQPY
jgi:hypothetical protein